MSGIAGGSLGSVMPGAGDVGKSAGVPVGPCGWVGWAGAQRAVCPANIRPMVARPSKILIAGIPILMASRSPAGPAAGLRSCRRTNRKRRLAPRSKHP